MIRDYLNDLTDAIASIPDDDVATLGTMLRRCWKSGRTLYICGNGGSGATASHMVADFSKSLLIETGAPLRTQCLSDNSPMLSAWSNDVHNGYDTAFRNILRCYASDTDYLLTISGSGKSANIVKALEHGNLVGMVTMALTGFDGGTAAKLAQHSVVVPVHDMQLAEDCHMAILHGLFRQLLASEGK